MSSEVNTGEGQKLPDVDANAFADTEELAQEVIRELKMAGACIVRHLYNEGIMGKLDREAEPHLTEIGNTTYFQKNVRTVPGMAGKSETYALEVIGNLLWTRVRDHFLTVQTGVYWVGDNQRTHQTSAQLGSAAVLELLPGTQAQGLHRDDLVHFGFNAAAEDYSLGRDKCLTFFAASHDTKRKNGATRIVPGSHLWDYSSPPPAPDDSRIVDAEINRGDALIILGSVIHGGGENSTKDEHRRVFSCGVCWSHLRQPENQYLAHEVESIRRLPLNIKKFIGYSPYGPGVGLVNWQDPLLVIEPDDEPDLTEK